MNLIDSRVAAPDAYIAIVIARVNHFINNSLLNGSIDILKRLGQIKNEHIFVVWVPGAYELPLTASVLAKSKKYDAIIALGTVIRGSTSHFEYIVSECISGLAAVALQYFIPVTCGVLTTDNIEQAIERAGTKSVNKGSEAALTALEMINVLKAIKV